MSTYVAYNLFTVRNKVRQGSERPQGLPEKFLSLAARKIMGAELNFLENFQWATRHGPCSRTAALNFAAEKVIHQRQE